MGLNNEGSDALAQRLREMEAGRSLGSLGQSGGGFGFGGLIQFNKDVYRHVLAEFRFGNKHVQLYWFAVRF